MRAPRPSLAGNPGLEAGFSLLELLVVLSIIGFVLTLAPAMLSAPRKSMDARTSASALASDLRLTRMEAIVSGQERDIRLDIGHGRYELPWRHESKSLPTSVQMSFIGPQHNIKDQDALIAFFPDGSSSGGAITLSGGKRSFTITSHWLTGRISTDG